MAFLVELEDENAETDIPTTIIRSKGDVNSAAAEINTLNTNDIVVNKLTQIFSYLRQGGKKKKNKKEKALFKVPDDPEDKPSTSKSRHAIDSIYDEDVGDYKPSRDRERDRHRDRRDRRHYDDGYGHSSKSSSSRESSSRKRGSYFDKPEDEEKEQGVINIPAPPKLSSQLITKLHETEPDSYAECYPGLQEVSLIVVEMRNLMEIEN